MSGTCYGGADVPHFFSVLYIHDLIYLSQEFFKVGIIILIIVIFTDEKTWLR